MIFVTLNYVVGTTLVAYLPFATNHGVVVYQQGEAMPFLLKPYLVAGLVNMILVCYA
jgi:hypothetical protein